MGQRDIELLVRALVIIDTCCWSHRLARASGRLGGAYETPRARWSAADGLAGAVVVYYFLLALVFLTTVRVLARAVNDRRLPGHALGPRAGGRC